MSRTSPVTERPETPSNERDMKIADVWYTYGFQAGLEAERKYGHAQCSQEPSYDQLRSVFEAAYGLCMGYDWNNGTAAKACGYKRKLLSSVNAIREVPDFEGKYRAVSDTSTDRPPLNQKTRCEECNLLAPCDDPKCPNAGATSVSSPIREAGK